MVKFISTFLVVASIALVSSALPNDKRNGPRVKADFQQMNTKIGTLNNDLNALPANPGAGSGIVQLLVRPTSPSCVCS